MRFAPLIFLLFFVTSCSRARVMREAPPILYKSKPCIMIDPGHGGEDFGTHSAKPPRYQEKVLNLATAQYLKNYLQQMGYKTIMTRTTDTFVSLKKRAEMANQDRPTLFVSIHYNSAPSTKAEGVEIYYYRSKDGRSEESKLLAKNILDHVLLQTGAKSRGVKHGDFAVIREAEVPAILIEGGFLTNNQEMQRIKETAYMKKIAQGIAMGVQQHLAGCSLQGK